MWIFEIPREIITSYQFYIGIFLGIFICWKFFIPYNIKWKEHVEKCKKSKEWHEFRKSLIFDRGVGIYSDIRGNTYCSKCIQDGKPNELIEITDKDSFRCPTCNSTFESSSYREVNLQTRVVMQNNDYHPI